MIQKTKSHLEILENSSPEELDRMVQMGWEDRTSFESISYQFGISPNEFVRLMRKLLEPSRFKRWRRRIFEQGKLKNSEKTGIKKTRFKCSRQNSDGLSKGWK